MIESGRVVLVLRRGFFPPAFGSSLALCLLVAEGQVILSMKRFSTNFTYCSSPICVHSWVLWRAEKLYAKHGRVVLTEFHKVWESKQHICGIALTGYNGNWGHFPSLPQVPMQLSDREGSGAALVASAGKQQGWVGEWASWGAEVSSRVVGAPTGEHTCLRKQVKHLLRISRKPCPVLRG